tara:strand:+ start:8263 stop:8907 length:645 start_codon:yes stop_codon:yes gene_type:complete
VRINLTLEKKGDWVKLFQPRDATIFVATEAPPQIGSPVRLDIIVGTGGPKVIFRGKVIARRLQGEASLPKGCSIALGNDEREKINYLNGYVRGGLLNLREARRIPVRLKVTYGGMKGPVDSYTRDINDEGVFVITEAPLPEESELHLFIEFPGRTEPLSLTGVVAHTVVVEDEDIPGMGIRFVLESEAGQQLTAIVDKLEKAFLSGQLEDQYLV